MALYFLLSFLIFLLPTLPSISYWRRSSLFFAVGFGWRLAALSSAPVKAKPNNHRHAAGRQSDMEGKKENKRKGK